MKNLRSKSRLSLIIAMALLGCSLVMNVAQGKQETSKEGAASKEKAKFTRAEKGAIKGEYIVRLVREVKRDEVEKIADELIAKYGGAIKMDNEITRDIKQPDGLIKAEIVRPAGKAIYKFTRSFCVMMTEAQAKTLSEDEKVDNVGENFIFQSSQVR